MARVDGKGDGVGSEPLLVRFPGAWADTGRFLGAAGLKKERRKFHDLERRRCSSDTEALGATSRRGA
jgi:hypothetical protein